MKYSNTPEGLSIVSSVATSLAIILPSSISATHAHYTKGNISVKSLVPLAVFGAIGALIFSIILPYIKPPMFKILLGIFEILMGLKMFSKKKSAKITTTQTEEKYNFVNLSLIGFIAGAISTTFGIGGGLIIVPALHLICNFSMVRAVGTSTAILVFTALIGSISYFIQGLSLPESSLQGQWGYIHIPSALLIIPFAMIFSRKGAFLASKVNDRILRMFFGLLMIGLGIRILWLSFV